MLLDYHISSGHVDVATHIYQWALDDDSSYAEGLCLSTPSPSLIIPSPRYGRLKFAFKKQFPEDRSTVYSLALSADIL